MRCWCAVIATKEGEKKKKREKKTCNGSDALLVCCNSFKRRIYALDVF